MGLFDGKVDYYRQAADTIAPAIEQSTGFVSPQRQMRRMVSQTDYSSSDSVQNTFNQLMKVNPTDAKAWLTSVKPLIEAEATKQSARTAKQTTRMSDIANIGRNQFQCDVTKDPECFKRSVAEYKTVVRQSPGEKGASENLKEAAKNYATNTQTIQERGYTATTSIPSINQSLELLDSGELFTGPGANIVQVANKIGSLLGYEPAERSAAAATQFVSNSMKQIMGWIGQTKGAISEKEMAAFTAASPNLAQTKAGNRLLLQTIKRGYEYEEKLANERARWAQADQKAFYEANPRGYYVPSPFRWQEHFAKWNAANKMVFPTQAEINAALGTGSGTVKNKTVKTNRFTVTED